MREPVGLDQFVVSAGPQLLRSAWLLTRDWHAAEDLVQTALLRLIPHWTRINGYDNPIFYVRRTMMNVYLSSRARHVYKEQPQSEFLAISDSSIDVYSNVDLRLTLLTALENLPRQQRAVIVLRYFDDLTEADTARVLGCSVGTVKSHAARALQNLRQYPQLRTSLDQGV